MQLPVPGLWFYISNEKGVLPLRFSPEILELLRKIVLLLCRKYGFDALTKDFNSKHDGETGQFAEKNSSGTSSAQSSAKEGASANAVSQEGKKMRRKILKEPHKVNSAAQAQHMDKKSAEAATKKEQKANPGAKVMPKSYFTEEFNPLCDEVIGKIRDNQFDEIIVRSGDTRFQVILDRNVGIAYNESGTKDFPTSVVEVVYSHKSGYHMWPARKKEGKN